MSENQVTEPSPIKQLLDGVEVDITENSEIKPFYMTAMMYWAVEIELSKAQLDVIEEAWELLDDESKVYYQKKYGRDYLIHDTLNSIGRKIFYTRVIDSEAKWKARQRGATQEDKDAAPLIRDAHGIGDGTWLYEELVCWNDGRKFKVHLIY